MAREWEKRESAKLKELERRTDAGAGAFEEQAQETIGKIAQTADQRKAEQEAQRRVAKTKRELREDFQTTVLATAGRFAPGRISAAAHRRGRARAAAATCASRRACGASWANGRIEVEAGFMKMQVSVDDVIEVLPEAGRRPAASCPRT